MGGSIRAAVPWRAARLAGALLAGCAALPAAAPAPAQDAEAPASALRLDASGRASLGGSWSLLLDPGAVGLEQGWLPVFGAGRRPEGAPSPLLSVPVPGPLEAARPAVRYDGVAWYRRAFALQGELSGARLSLRFGQVNYACRAWLDGQALGEHEGGYDAFSFDVTGRVAPGRSHVLVLMVVDPGPVEAFGLTLATTPHAKESWYHNFGGVLGPVELLAERGPRARDVEVVVDAEKRSLTWRCALDAPPGAAGTTILALDLLAEALPLGAPADAAALHTLARERWNVSLPAGSVDLLRTLQLEHVDAWSPEAPHRVRVRLWAAGRVLAERVVGLRSVSLVQGDFLLNGQRRVPKGVLYQPHFTGRGGVAPAAGALQDEVRALRETGFDLVRVHVRPAPEVFLDACDQLGLMVLEEPAIGWVQDAPQVLGRLRREIEWMVRRDRHHPSIVMWGVLNEMSGKAFRHADELLRFTASLDPGRPVLEDSGGFLGARFVPAAGGRPRPMLDEHVYPPFPLPFAERDRWRTAGGEGPAPLFVSEFGFGGPLDAPRALRPFREDEIWSAERFLFEGLAATARRAPAGHGLRLRDGLTPLRAGQLAQARAAVELVRALRSNPALDLLCYTQWRAVSSECSSGVLAPWGQPRPVRQALRHVLRPLAAWVFPARPSLFEDEPQALTLAVVNDSGAPLERRLVLEARGQPRDGGAPERRREDLGVHRFEPGVTTLQATLKPWTGRSEVRLEARLEGLAGDPDGNDPALPEERTRPTAGPLVPILPRPAGPPSVVGSGAQGTARPVRVWVPDGSPEAQAFLQRVGFATAGPDTADVALLTHAGQPASFEDRMRLWHRVWHGGAALVLLDDPSALAQVQRLRTSRGQATLAALPVPVQVARAAGNFMGRLHVLRRDGSGADGLGWLPPGGEPRGGARDEPLLHGMASMSPRAMVVGPLPAGSSEAMLTLGHTGNRLGAPLARIPFGQGQLVLVGLPLLEPVGGAPDPLREAWLARLLVGSALPEPVPGTRPAFVPLPAEEAGELAYGWELLAQVAALADHVRRPAPAAADARLPYLRRVDEALVLGARAWGELAQGQPALAREQLLQAVSSVWDEATKAFLALDGRVRGRIQALLATDDPAHTDRIYRGFELWYEGLAAWFADDQERALALLGRAELQLGGEDG